MSTRKHVLAAIAASAGLTAASVMAQQDQAAPEMTPEQKAMMDAWAKAGAVGPQHEAMAKTAGKWKVTCTVWMSPGAEPQTSQGSAKRTVVLDGRVLMEEFRGQFMGEAFQGLGLSGYDNVTRKYWGTWNDSMSTALFRSEGTCNEAHTRCEHTMTGTDPMTGKPSTMRTVYEMTDTNTERASFYETRDGKEFKSMELLYKRE